MNMQIRRRPTGLARLFVQVVCREKAASVWVQTERDFGCYNECLHLSHLANKLIESYFSYFGCFLVIRAAVSY